MYTFMIVSYILCLMSNSWVTIWILLEVNTLAFCSLAKMNSKDETQSSSESTMKYFIVQSIASGMLVATAIFPKQEVSPLLFSIASFMALMVKAAAAPLHLWFIQVAKSTKWSTNLILFTWQKMAPLYLVMLQMKALACFFIVSSSILGAVSMFNKKELKEIMAWSSIFNLGWIILAIMVSTKIFFLFLALYWVSVLFILQLISKTKAATLENLLTPTKKDSVMFIVANLAGLPPLMGFLAKWMTFSEGLKENLILIPTVLLVLSTINLYLYLRMTSSSLLKGTSGSQKSLKLNSTLANWAFLLMNGIALSTISV